MTINTRTQLCGIIGNPVDHSLSPAIHNAAAAHLDINAVYLAFNSVDPKQAIDAMRALNIRSFSVTIPHKETVMAYVDEVEPQAEELGNINTIVNQDGRLTGYNTDIDGIELSLKEVVIKNESVLLLGAGGVAHTLASVIARQGGRLVILNRDVTQARTLAERYGASAGALEEIEPTIQRTRPRLIINATPVGMGKLSGMSLVPPSLLEKTMVVFDVIYTPRQTKLLHDAADAGCRTISGAIMFLGQGARQFELWSGQQAPLRIMEQAFEKQLAEGSS